MSSRATPTADDQQRREQADADDEDDERRDEGQDRPVVGVGRQGVQGGRLGGRPAAAPRPAARPRAARRRPACRRPPTRSLLFVPQRTLAADPRQRREVVVRRRRGRGPLERPGVPGVVAGRLARRAGCCTMLTKSSMTTAHADDVAADRRDQVERVPAEVRARRCRRAAACPACRGRTSGRR